VGAFLGGTLFTLVRTGTLTVTAASLNIPGLIVSVIGAIIAIYLWGVFRSRSSV